MKSRVDRSPASLRGQKGFTLIELLVVILIIGILIAVSAPSFLGQTSKAHDSAAKQENATAYQSAKAFAVGDNGNSFGTTASLQAYLNTNEPELVASTTVTVSGGGSTLTAVSTNGGRACTLVADVNQGITSDSSCAAASVASGPYGPITPGAMVQLTTASGGADIAAVSPDGNTVIYTDYNSSDLWTMTPSGASQASLSTSSPFGYGVWASNSQSFLYQGNPASNLDVYSFASSSATAIASDLSSSGIEPAAWLHATTVVYSTGSDIRSIPAAGGAATVIGAAAGAAYVNVLPDGRIVYLTSGSVRVMDSGGTSTELIAAGVDGNTTSVFTSPDGTKVAIGTNNGIWVYNIDGSSGVQVTSAPQSGPEWSWSPDSSKLAYEKHPGVDNFDLYAVNVDGSHETDLSNTVGIDEWSQPSWGPNSDYVLISSSRDSPNGEIYKIPVG